MYMTRAEELILRNQIAIMSALAEEPPLRGARMLLTEGINKTHVVLHNAKAFAR